MSSLPSTATHKPDEEALRRKRKELRHREALLVERELELGALLGELLHFRALYTQTVGMLYVELDRLRARRARRVAQERSADMEAERRAREAERAAEESSTEFEEARAETAPFVDRPEPTTELKKVYRRLAKRYHPDLAATEQEAARRTEIMARINAAYRACDLEALLRIERDAQQPAEADQELDLAAELMHIILKIQQAESRIREIDLEIAELKRGDDWHLYVQWKDLREKGIDLLDKICAELRDQIATEQARAVP